MGNKICDCMFIILISITGTSISLCLSNWLIYTFFYCQPNSITFYLPPTPIKVCLSIITQKEPWDSTIHREWVNPDGFSQIVVFTHLAIGEIPPCFLTMFWQYLTLNWNQGACISIIESSGVYIVWGELQFLNNEQTRLNFFLSLCVC